MYVCSKNARKLDDFLKKETPSIFILSILLENININNNKDCHIIEQQRSNRCYGNAEFTCYFYKSIR